MKVSDFIVGFIIKKGVTDVFGYPGGMVTHLMDSFDRYKNEITAHVCYHEQAAAFEACGYSQISGKLGVAYATSGPGATNLITGIANAYFDSIPTMFITGQVNRNESKARLGIRQRGFQETDIVNLVDGITKYCVYVEKPEKIVYYLEKAYFIAMGGRKGPVLLDIPMDVMRSEIDADTIPRCFDERSDNCCRDYKNVFDMLASAKRPCIIAGAAVDNENDAGLFRELVDKLKVPVVTSMISVDLVSRNNKYCFGFLGAYGDRCANFIVAKSDFILSFGARLDIRQTGADRGKFAPDAVLVRIDIDQNELNYRVHDNEIDICDSVNHVLSYFSSNKGKIPLKKGWLDVCAEIKSRLEVYDNNPIKEYIGEISDYISDEDVVTTDVGQNQVWISQYFISKGQRILFSGGLGSMGYSLPAAIGAYYGSHKRIISFCGDGGFMMNMQELQFIKREKLPVKIVVFNNHALGMIRHFQEMYFDKNYAQTVDGNGYEAPDFKKIANAFDMTYLRADSVDDINSILFENMEPVLIEINITDDTYVFPKLEFGKPNQDQEPLIDRKLYEELMKL